ncbi:MAG TPA: hypothetical protein ENN55_02495 [Firmicutes bacterium]|nr:hypothetical protein [Bacillota bacterium]
MKKTGFILFFLPFFCMGAGADTLFNPGKRLLNPGEFSVSYEEKYLEYRVFYGDDEYYLDKTQGMGEEMLRGIFFEFGVRYGITESITAGGSMLYIFQKILEYEHSDFHFAALNCDWKVFEHLNLFFEIKLPFQNEISDDIRLFNSKERLSLLASVSSGYKAESFRFNVSGGVEHILAPSEWLRRYTAAGMLGFDIYGGKNGQKVGFNLEGVYTLDDTEYYYSNIFSAAPQIEMVFAGGFRIIIGAEILLYADNTHRNKTFFGRDTYTGSDLTYMVRLSYLFGGEKPGRMDEIKKKEDSSKECGEGENEGKNCSH